ncbi:MAG TPA: TatD family hydrolase [Acidimicrobiales bacterium]|nr:TatD family hydrolase [Acidimicrobiales bacterium]
MASQDALSWFDSHCHVQEHYEPDTEVLARAAELGVTHMVCVGTDAASSAQALELSASPPSGSPRIWATVGLHPHEASRGIDEVAALLDRAMADGPRPVAVGECGLDYYYEHSPRSAQRDVFAAQIGLAQRHHLALVIHARDAWDDLFDVLTAEGVPDRTVLHCFTGGPTEARRCLDAGLFLSFSGIVTFNNATEVREAATLCPLDRLLVETDSPFLAPAPHRGKRNEPGNVSLVGAFVAGLKGLEPSVVASSSWQAAADVFAIATS